MTDKPPARSHTEALKASMAYAAAQAAQRPKPLKSSDIEAERRRCRSDIFYFADHYAYIEDKVTQSWEPLVLWPSQIEVIQLVLSSKYTIFLKARQLGITWINGGLIPLWLMIFHPISPVLLFSQRDEDAMALLDRLKGMYDHLPDWMKVPIKTSNEHELILTNGSIATAAPSSAGGRGQWARWVLADESDYMPNTRSLVKAAKPTIDDGPGQLVLQSTVNDETPNSFFQVAFKEALKGETEWKALFLSWRAHPGRTQEWYDKLCRSTLILEGTLDSVYQEYPESVDQALSGRSSNKRFPPMWISYFSQEEKPRAYTQGSPSIPNLHIFRAPEQGRRYGIGVDPAGGTGTSDDSVLLVIDAETREECAVIGGQIEVPMLLLFTYQVSLYYNQAVVLVERNNHGDGYIRDAKRDYPTMTILPGLDGKPGWHTSYSSKLELYKHGYKLFQTYIGMATQEGELPLILEIIATLPKLIHDPYTISQLTAIDAGDHEKAPAAPEGLKDDFATAWVLAQMCFHQEVTSMEQFSFSWNTSVDQDVESGRFVSPHALSRPTPRPITSGGENITTDYHPYLDEATKELMRLYGVKPRGKQ